jgi:hypothetical protein
LSFSSKATGKATISSNRTPGLFTHEVKKRLLALRASFVLLMMAFEEQVIEF